MKEIWTTSWNVWKQKEYMFLTKLNGIIFKWCPKLLRPFLLSCKSRKNEQRININLYILFIYQFHFILSLGVMSSAPFGFGCFFFSTLFPIHCCCQKQFNKIFTSKRMDRASANVNEVIFGRGKIICTQKFCTQNWNERVLCKKVIQNNPLSCVS